MCSLCVTYGYYLSNIYFNCAPATSNSSYATAPVQSRKARASTSIYEFNSVVIGQHVYKRVYGLHSLTKA